MTWLASLTDTFIWSCKRDNIYWPRQLEVEILGVRFVTHRSNHRHAAHVFLVCDRTYLYWSQAARWPLHCCVIIVSAKVKYIQTLLQSEYKGDCHSFVMLINFNKEQEFRDIPGSGLYFHDFSKQIDSYLVYHSPTAIQIVSRFQQIANIFVMLTKCFLIVPDTWSKYSSFN